jgi:hypothetical protein
MRTSVTLALLTAATCAFGSQARAGGDVGVVVTGEGSMQPELAAQISDWLSRHGHTVVASPLPAEAIPLLVDCFVLEKLACARDIVETRAKSASVVYAHVDAESSDDDGTREVTLTAYWLAKGKDAITERRTCARCNARSLRTTADEIMTRLIGGEAHVKFRSTPQGARIVIDGQAIGVTPLDWELPPGKHSIQLDMDGFAPTTREIVIASGQTELVSVELTRPEKPEPLLLRHLPLGMLVTGGALVATGGILIAIDEDAGGPLGPPTFRESAPLGVGLVIGGSVIAGAGAYFLWFRPARKTTAPVAVFTSDSAYVGWSGRF